MAAQKADKEVAAPKKSKKKIIVIIIVLMLLAGAGAGISFWFFNLRDPSSPLPSSGSALSPSPPANTDPGSVTAPATLNPADAPRTPISIVTLPTVNVNLSDPSGDRYLKLSMEVEVNTAEAAQELDRQQARVRDALIILLSSKTYAELATPAGKMQLKNDIAARLNQILGTPRVVRVYYTDFVVN